MRKSPEHEFEDKLFAAVAVALALMITIPLVGMIGWSAWCHEATRWILAFMGACGWTAWWLVGREYEKLEENNDD